MRVYKETMYWYRLESVKQTSQESHFMV